MKHIHKCLKCGNYTMKKECCNLQSLVAKPLKYSPDDNLSDYRRKAKMEEYQKRGLI